MVTPDPRADGYYVSFLYGQVDKSIFGRYDTEEYNYSCSRLENFLISSTGGAERRPGTIYMGELKTVASHPKKRLALYKQTRGEAYVVELGENYARFWNKDGQEKFGHFNSSNATGNYATGSLANNGANSVRIVSGNNTIGWTARDLFGTISNGLILNAGAGNNVTVSGNISESTSAYELITPYDDDDLDEIDIKHFYIYLPNATATATTGNSWKIVNLLFHDQYEPRIIHRRGNYAWHEEANNATGHVDKDRSGGMFYTYKNVVSGNNNTTGSANNFLSVANQRPSCAEPFNGRMVVSGRLVEPLTVRMSKVDSPGGVPHTTSQMDFGYGWFDGVDDSEILSADAIDLVLPQTRGAKIHWVLEYEGLFAGLDDGIVAIETSEGIWSPEMIPSAKKVTAIGTAPIIAKVFNNSVYYVMRERKKMRELIFSQEKGGYLSRDLNLLSSKLFVGKIRGFDVQYEPVPTVWVWDDEGYAYTLADTGGWSKHWFGYPVESLCVMPGDGEDIVWLCVIKDDVPIMLQMAPRTWNDREEGVYTDFSVVFDNGAAVDITDISIDAGDGKVTITADNSFSEDDIVKLSGITGTKQANNMFKVKDESPTEFILYRLDGAGYIDGSAWDAYESGGTARKAQKDLTGLTHLAEETVSIVVDGGNYGEAIVEADGTLELETYYSYIIVGKKYESVLETLPLKNYKNKRIYTYTLFMHDSLGGKVGETDADLSTVYPIGRLELDSLPDLINEPVRRNFKGSHGIKSSLVVVQDYPLPFNIDSIAVEYVQATT